MLLKKEYQIGNISKYEEELKNIISKLYYDVQEEYTYLVNTRADMHTGEDLSTDELIKRYNNYKKEIKVIRRVNREWILDENSYLINPEVDSIIEKALIRNNLLDEKGYLLSYSNEINSKKKENLEKEIKNNKRVFRFSTLFGVLGFCTGIGLSILGYDMYTVNEGKKSIYEEIDEDAKDFDLYRNGNGELHATYEKNTYDDASKAILIFASDMKECGYDDAEIAVYIKDCVHNGSINYSYISKLLDVKSYEMRKVCKIKYHEDQVLKLKKSE